MRLLFALSIIGLAAPSSEIPKHGAGSGLPTCAPQPYQPDEDEAEDPPTFDIA